MKCEIPTVINMNITAFCSVKPCSIVHTYK